MNRIPATVYLIHFDRPYKHARHYVGYTAAESLEDRLARHRSGRGARLLHVVQRAGISWQVVRTWRFDSIQEARRKERALKGRGQGPRCPACRCLSTQISDALRQEAERMLAEIKATLPHQSLVYRLTERTVHPCI